MLIMVITSSISFHLRQLVNAFARVDDWTTFEEFFILTVCKKMREANVFKAYFFFYIVSIQKKRVGFFFWFILSTCFLYVVCFRFSIWPINNPHGFKRRTTSENALTLNSLGKCWKTQDSMIPSKCSSGQAISEALLCVKISILFP